MVARGNVGVWCQSDYCTITLFLFSVCWELAKGKIIKKSDNATIIKPKDNNKTGTAAWLEREGLEAIGLIPKVTVFKKVSSDFKTQETTPNETLWEVGTTVKLDKYEPKEQECGPNKFHACSTPFFCDEFRDVKGDRYIAIEVKKSNLYAWPNPSYPHKIAFGEGKVLYECNKLGKKK